MGAARVESLAGTRSSAACRVDEAVWSVLIEHRAAGGGLSRRCRPSAAPRLATIHVLLPHALQRVWQERTEQPGCKKFGGRRRPVCRVRAGSTVHGCIGWRVSRKRRHPVVPARVPAWTGRAIRGRVPTTRPHLPGCGGSRLPVGRPAAFLWQAAPALVSSTPSPISGKRADIHVGAGEAISIPASSTWTPRPLPALRLTSPAWPGRGTRYPCRPASDSLAAAHQRPVRSSDSPRRALRGRSPPGSPVRIPKC